MQKISSVVIAFVFASLLFFVQLPQAKADEPKTFIGTIESFRPVMSRPPKWPIARFTAVANKGEKIEIYILQRDTTVIDIDGKSIENKRPQVGKKVEIKYTTGEHEIYGGERYEAISIRYVPADYASQPSAQTGAAQVAQPAAAIASEGPGHVAKDNIFVGKVVKGGVTFSVRCPYRFVIILDNGEKKDIWIPRDGLTINDVNGKPVVGAPPRAGKRMEIKYLIGDNGQYEAASMRYVPENYVAQPTALITSTQVPAAQAAGQGNVFIGTIDRLFSLDSMARVVPDNGGQYMYFKLKEATLTDVDGKAISWGSLAKGQRVEVKYSQIIGTGASGAKTAQALSLRSIPNDYIPADYVQQLAAPTPSTQSPTAQPTDTFTGTVESFPCGVGHFKSGPPLWPVGMIVVIGNNGEKNNFLIVRDGTNATTFYDADGKISSFMNNIKAVIGKKVEVKYAITEQSTRYLNKMLAISVRYLN